MLFAQIIEEENAKSNLFRVFEHESNESHEYLFVIDFPWMFVCANRLCRGQRPIPKKCLIESNELLRMLVRILVLDYRSLLTAHSNYSLDSCNSLQACVR